MLSKKGNSDRYIRENGSTETYNIKCNNKEILPAQSQEWVKFFFFYYYYFIFYLQILKFQRFWNLVYENSWDHDNFYLYWAWIKLVYRLFHFNIEI